MVEHNSLHKLAEFLRSHGDSLLNNSGPSSACKLSLTTRALAELSKQLSMVLQNEHPESDSFAVLGYDASSSQMRDLLFIHDILQKVTKLKLVTSPSTVEGEVSLSRFGSLRQLDLQRVPPHLLTPMCPSQAAELRVLEAHRCLTGAKALLKLSGGAPWTKLETLRLSHNMLLTFGLDQQTINKVPIGIYGSRFQRANRNGGRRDFDGGNEGSSNQNESRLNYFDQSTKETDTEHDNENSVKMSHLLPALRNLDISHNQIREVDLSGLEYLSCVDLSFNFISKVPRLNRRSSLLFLSHLCIRNNLLEDLQGLETLTALKVLDLGHNMMSEFNVLEPLANLLQLDRLTLEGNPLSLHDNYPSAVSAHLAKSVILDNRYDVHSERTHALTTTATRVPISLIHGRTTDSVGDHSSVGELECPSIIDGRIASSTSSVRTGKTRQSTIDDPVARQAEFEKQFSIIGSSVDTSNLRRVAEECRRDHGHSWLITAAKDLQLPTAQSTPLPKTPQLQRRQQNNPMESTPIKPANAPVERKESRQSDDCLVVTDEPAPWLVELTAANENNQALPDLPKGACPSASLRDAALMTTSQTESIDESSSRQTLTFEDPSSFAHNQSDKEESPAIGVIDAEPPEINDEDIEALADTNSDGTFLSAAATPTGGATEFNLSHNTLEETRSSVEQVDKSLRRSMTSMDDSDRLEEDGAVWARLRELRRSGLDYDYEHSMSAEEKVHLEMQVFKTDENFRAAFRAFIVLTPDRTLDGYLILSNHRMYVSKTRISTPDGGVLWSVPLARLRRATIQLGAQALVIETDDGSADWEPSRGSGPPPNWILTYIGDSGWCAQLAQLINLHMPDKARLLRSEVGSTDLLASLHLENETLRAYSQGYWRILDDGGSTPLEKSYVCIAVASQDVVVVRERHVEPEKVKFTEVCTRSITAVTSLALEENDPRIANVTFALDETGMREQVWYFETASVASMFVFIESLRQPWQEIFDVELPLSYIQ